MRLTVDVDVRLSCNDTGLVVNGSERTGVGLAPGASTVTTFHIGLSSNRNVSNDSVTPIQCVVTGSVRALPLWTAHSLSAQSATSLTGTVVPSHHCDRCLTAAQCLVRHS
jgi:hypothetical protein